MKSFVSLLTQSIVVVVATGALFFCQSSDSTKQDVVAKAPAAQPASVDQTTPSTKSPGKQERKLVVYYFHGNFRCHSCNMIENLTKKAVNSGFADQLKSGSIEIKVINIEEPDNKHFVDDYKLYTKSVILSDVKGGKETGWKNCEKVWTLLGNEEKFIEYIQSEIKTFL